MAVLIEGEMWEVDKRIDTGSLQENVNPKSTSLEEAVEPYGLLYGTKKHGWFFTWGSLRYYKRKQKKYREVATAINELNCVHASSEEVYFDYGNKEVKALKSKFKSSKRGFGISCLCEHKGRIIDGGWYGLVDTKTNRSLISREQLKARGIITITSLLSGGDELFALYKTEKERGIIEIRKEGLEYSLGEEVLHYDSGNRAPSQAIVIPVEEFTGLNGKDYNFSVLSCANLNYLDINGEKIAGGEGGEKIYRVVPWCQEGNYLDVVMSKHKKNEVVRVTINLEKRQIIDQELLLRTAYPCKALFPVTNMRLHNKLM